MTSGWTLSGTAEFEGASLGDERLNKRLLSIATEAARRPGASFPKMLPTEGQREALYRFIENERVDWRQVLKPHRDATRKRAEGASSVRVAHDTTLFSFKGDRAGLGPIAITKRGFGAHVSLAIADGDTRAPLGVAAISTLVRRDDPVARTKEAKGAKKVKARETPRPEKESARWLEGVLAAESQLGGQGRCIHVMDQEADDFSLLAELIRRDLRFVIRGSSNRCLDRNKGIHVRDALEQHELSVFRSVPLSERKKAGPNHPARVERMANLSIRATEVSLPKPQHAQHKSERISINVIQVAEPQPPSGAEPIEWVLYTTEPIDSAEDLVAAVDHYRARWRIEEYFKALKTGCAFEKRQLTSLDALLRALALFLPIAWQLLQLRTLGRETPDRPASDVMSEAQMVILKTLVPSFKWPAAPTVRSTLLAIAMLGGHIRSNGDPGWLVLGRGFEDFLRAEAIWAIACAQGRSDQS